jgi:vitamin-K-epoxide reductase (warfarin-sensitive)
VQPAVTASPPASPPSSRREPFLFILIAIFALAGIIVSAISLQRHYARSATQFCDFNQKFSCDIVNRSAYSSIAGIPVAGIGVAGYALLFVLCTFLRNREETANRLLGAAIAGLAFALYLTYIEAYVLETWCILCLISLGMIIMITALSLAVRLTGKRT